MLFLIDECTAPAVGRWLRRQNHNMFSVYEEARGARDEWVIQKAFAENRILITNDKDFGELIFREKRLHKGVILLRLEDERAVNKIAILRRLLDRYADYLAGNFIVVTETTVRIEGRKPNELPKFYPWL